MSGIRMATAMTIFWARNESATVQGFLVLPTPSTNDCSNMRLNPPSPFSNPGSLTLRVAESFYSKSRAGGGGHRHGPALRLLRFHRASSRGVLPVHGSGGRVPPPVYKIVPEQNDGAGDEHRRIGADENAGHQTKRKAVQYLSAEQQQRQGGEESEAGGQNGAAQRLVDAAVDDRFQRLPARGAEIFADA